MRTRAIPALLSLFVIISACGGGSTSSAVTASTTNTPLPGCSFDAAVRDAKGVARLALLVGVGAYQHESIRKLQGPANDVALMKTLLSGPGGYGFAEQNVCSLLDATATGANFRRAFENALVKRAQRGDIVVIYFAGHGTQLPDTNRDESDLSDEVLMFADSRTKTANDLRDDEFDTLLKPLRETSNNVTVILDACHSGSGTRLASSGLIERQQPPREEDLRVVESSGTPRGTNAAVEFLDPADGLITIAAAVDGTVAIEREGAGVFTTALASALSQVTAEPLTWQQLRRKVIPLVAASSRQVPQFEGALEQVVFGADQRTRPLALEVTTAGEKIQLGGTLVPGMGSNAELRVFDSGAQGTAFNDPAKSKAMLIVESASGPNAVARVISKPEGAPPIVPGDLAVLVRPSDDAIAMKVRIRPAGEPLGVPAANAEKLRAAIQANSEAALLVSVSDTLADFEIALDGSRRYQTIGPEGRIRNVQSTEQGVAENLWRHARQRAFLQLRSESGSEFADDSSLIVTLEPSTNPQKPCVRPGAQLSRDTNGTYIVPLCYGFQIHVKLAPNVTTPMRVGGLALSSDGSIFGFPPRRSAAILTPGGPPVMFSKTFYGTQPVSLDDHLLIFATREENAVDWAELTTTAVERSASGGSSLQRAVDRYLRGRDARGLSAEDAQFNPLSWTRTAIAVRTEPNPGFEPGAVTVDPGSREYTIKEFNIKPYLPDDEASALHKVLLKADWLAHRDVSYQQHDWSAGGDEGNLAKGIDCSRSIWFAFTRAGLPFNAGDRYLTTADMAAPNSRMSEQFEQCPLGTHLAIGDLLVYRDTRQGDGHVVMVIDPAKRIAWGSHGWDGNPKVLPVEPDTGVEYQLIKFKKDWERWDRKTMSLAACWRYKEFARARARGTGDPGIKALGVDPCATGVCTGRTH